MKSFTVIIPNFNCEKYIRNALDSIINNDYNKDLIQVLVIDDGSTDDSVKIIKNEYTNKYKYITLVEKSNGQWGSVINYAKNSNLIKNDIVSVLDSDDTLKPDCFKTVNKRIKEADLFFGSYAKWNGTKETLKVRPFFHFIRRKVANNNQMKTPIPLPLVVFSRKEIFLKCKDLSEGIPYQDIYLLSQLIQKAQIVRWTAKITGRYFYNRPDNSVSKKWDVKRFQAELETCEACLKNDNQEFFAYKLNLRQFNKLVRQKELQYVIKRPFNFKFFPFYIRWIYSIMNRYKTRGIFLLREDE